MATRIRKYFTRRKKAIENPDELRTASMKRRMTLARDNKTSKEILYYLAENDPDPAVRLAVAENKAMPAQVSPVLAADSSVDVRLALAGRLVDLLPHVSEDKQSQLYAFVVQALGTLALDEVLKIRMALSSTLKDHVLAPPKVAGQLARDVEREVSEPVLRFCAALADEDLLDILKSHPASWVVEAIATRGSVSEYVSEAVIKTEDRPGGVALLGNEGANITKSLLHVIVEKSRQFPEWQKPVALRKSLPIEVVRDLAGFVDASVRDILVQREDFDEQTTEEISEIFRRRLDFATEEGMRTEPLELYIRKLMDEDRLTEGSISDALAMRDYDFVYMAIACLAQTKLKNIESIFEAKAPKSVVALSWHAGLSMRMAFQLQKEVAHIQPTDLIYPKGGTDYPLNEDEINWQLEFLGLKAA